MKLKKTTLKYMVIAIIALIVLSAVIYKINNPYYPNDYVEKPVLGDPNAKIIIEVFSDMECPFCKQAHDVVKQILSEHEPDRVSYKFYNFPLTSIHPYAFKAAEASECANDQGMYYEFIDAAYLTSEDLKTPALLMIAENLGLEIKSFKACLKSGAKEDSVKIDVDEGTARGLTGTPSIYINGQKLDDWRYENFRVELDVALSKQSTR